MRRVVIKHSGIKGQKWGTRNGPPYPLDYEDHSSEEKKLNPRSRIDGNSGTNYRDYNAPRLTINDLTDEELEHIVNRRQLEARYKDINDKEESRGRARAREILQTVGAGLAVATATATMIAAFKKLAEKAGEKVGEKVATKVVGG